MPSLYTDAAREERYAKLRAKRIRLDRTLDIIGWITLLTMGIGLIVNAIGGFLSVLSLNFHDGIKYIFDIALTAAVIYAIYKRDRLISGVVLGVTVAYPVLEALIGGMGISINLFAPIIMVLVLAVDIQWYKLSQEEGFPLFDISYAEQVTRRKQMEQITKNRAVAAGIRVAATEQSADMGDLLDAGFDRPVMAPTLSGYHDRMQDAKPGTQRAASYQPGVMDMLEDLGAPPSSGKTASDPMPEVPDRLPEQPHAT